LPCHVLLRAATAGCRSRQVTLGYPKGVFRGCAPEGPALKCFLKLLSSLINERQRLT
jgi:hypothetical protein